MNLYVRIPRTFLPFSFFFFFFFFVFFLFFFFFFVFVFFFSFPFFFFFLFFFVFYAGSPGLAEFITWHLGHHQDGRDDPEFPSGPASTKMCCVASIRPPPKAVAVVDRRAPCHCGGATEQQNERR